MELRGPILAGDRIGVAVSVKAKRLNSKGDRNILTLGFTVCNQRKEIVQEGEAILLARNKPVESASG